MKKVEYIMLKCEKRLGVIWVQEDACILRHESKNQNMNTKLIVMFSKKVIAHKKF